MIVLFTVEKNYRNVKVPLHLEKTYEIYCNEIFYDTTWHINIYAKSHVCMCTCGNNKYMYARKIDVLSY